MKDNTPFSEATSVSLYNDTKIDFSKEKMFFGEGKNTQRFDVLKYPFLDKSNDKQQGFDWKHDEVPLTADTKEFKLKFIEHERFMYTRGFQKLIFLDSLQGRGPVSIFGQISTLPELENVINVWQYFEGSKHSRTYTEILRALYDNPDEIFDEAFTIPELQKIAKSIAGRYEDAYHNVIGYIYREQRKLGHTKEQWFDLKKSLIMCMVEINALEGLRFYAGFAVVWAKHKSTGYTAGCSENLQLICRDENEHLALTQFILKLFRKEKSEGFVEVYEQCKDEIEERYYEIFEEEKEWIEYIFSQGSFVGLNGTILIQYLIYLTVRRMEAIGIKVDKERLGGKLIRKNPLPWINTYINMDSNEKLPQQEKILNYITGGVNQDKDDDEILKSVSHLL
jgi:ribonucleoside-diphosphate reductase beta chain